MVTSKQFYKKFKAEGLAQRKTKMSTRKEVAYLKRLVNKKSRILDLCCGYGRISIPLAKQGYNVQGIDLTPNLIKKAKETARKEKVKIAFRIGDMRKLPYKDNSFDAIFCLWTAFAELIKREDQVKSLKEMFRVLSPKGIVFIDLPRNKKRTKKQMKTSDFMRKGRFLIPRFGPIIGMPLYIHTKKSLKSLMKSAKIRKFKIKIGDFGGRDRLILKFWKK